MLTQTNDEALLITGLLRRRGIEARLVQDNDGFDVCNLLELRFFLKKLREGSSAAFIAEEAWEQAEAAMRSKFAGSTALPLALEILGAFRRAHEKRYRSDLEMFLHESQMQDFTAPEKGQVVVSTIHKAKGREFDGVYMLLDPLKARTDEELRVLYVGMTRARNLLHIHCRGEWPALEKAHALRVADDAAAYPEPSETVMQLGLRDVFLGFCKAKQRAIFRIMSGEILECRGSELGTRMGSGFYPLLRFSKSFQEKLARLKGYAPVSATVRFIVVWKDLEEQKEYAVPLPDLTLKKLREG